MRGAALVAVALALGGCSERTEMSAAPAGTPPVAAGSGTPDLHVGHDGRLLLSWVEPTSDGSALRFSALAPGGWTEAHTVAGGSDWLVNWADIASVTSGADGAMVAHWRVTGGIRVSASRDGGGTWSEPVALHEDDSATERGFVTIVPVGKDFVAVWLDGREAPGAMTLRAATLRADGTVAGETLLDDRTCDCCPTDAVLAESTVVVAYRDRSPSEVRDISVCRMDLATGRWEEPAALHADGWTIAGCPVNGPALAAAGRDVACAWFTLGATGDGPRVNVALSRDEGRTFGPSVRVDLGTPVGRCDLAAEPDGSWLASWMEDRGEGADAEIRVRRITAAGKMDPSRVAAVMPNDRASGRPRLARAADGAWLAWTQPGDSSQVRVVRLP